MLADLSLFGRNEQVFKITTEELFKMDYLLRISIYIHEIHDIAKNHVLSPVNYLSGNPNYNTNVKSAFGCLAENAKIIIGYLELEHNLRAFHSEITIMSTYRKYLKTKVE